MVRCVRRIRLSVQLENLRRLIGMGGDRLLATVAPGLNEERDPGKAIAERRKDIFLRRYLPTVRPTPGARDLVKRFRDDGLTRTIATSATGDELKALLRAAHVDDLVSDAATSDDASLERQRKPGSR